MFTKPVRPALKRHGLGSIKHDTQRRQRRQRRRRQRQRRRRRLRKTMLGPTDSDGGGPATVWRRVQSCSQSGADCCLGGLQRARIARRNRFLVLTLRAPKSRGSTSHMANWPFDGGLSGSGFGSPQAVAGGSHSAPGQALGVPGPQCLTQSSVTSCG